MNESTDSPKELTDSERLAALENQINKKITEGYNLVNKSGYTFIVGKKARIGFLAWFLIGGILLFIPLLGPVLFGIWTIVKIINIVNRKEIIKSYGIDKYGQLKEVTF